MNPALAASPAGTPESWGIVGGGMLGMAMAHRLAQAGRQVTIFEDADHLGGLADPWTIGDVVWDRHYHVTLLSDRYLRALLEELGLDQEMEWTETRTGFYTDGQLVSMSNTVEFLRFPPLRLLDKFRLGLTILYASRVKQWRKLEKVLVEDWLTRWSGRNTFERIWRPLLRSKLGEAYQDTSAAFIWATIDRLYEARRSGLKRELFGYVPGGYDRILKRFAPRLEEEGVRLRLKEGARRVAPTADGRVGLETSAGALERFDQVVITAPSPVAARLVPDLSEDERARLQGVRYQGIVCASVLLREPLSEYYVTNITEPWVPFTGVIEMSTLVNRKHLGGHCLVYLPKYVAPDDPLFERTDQEIQESFLSALERMYPHFRRDQVLAFRVSRVRHVFALTTLNYSDRLPPTTTSLPGIHLVNSAHVLNGTLNVNATLRLAESAVQGLLSPARRAILPAY
jgi:protoporphyrinogen oxidase